MSVDVWAPYAFAVGDRVRVRLSGECRVQWWTESGVEDGHPIGFDGMTGRVVGLYSESDPRRPWAATHQYGVELEDGPVWGCGMPWFGGYFAAAELESLTAAQPAPRPAGEE